MWKARREGGFGCPEAAGIVDREGGASEGRVWSGLLAHRSGEGSQAVFFGQVCRCILSGRDWAASCDGGSCCALTAALALLLLVSSE